MYLKKLIRQIIGDRAYVAAHGLKQRLTQDVAPPPAVDSIERSGAQSEEFWATREKDNPGWVRGYWDGRTLPARQAIAEAIAELDAKTVLEVGSHSGANLWAIDQKKTYALLAGVELSEHVLDASKELLGGSIRSPFSVQLGNGKRLPFDDDSFDVVLSSIMLSCVGPENVESVLKEMVRVSRRYIVMAEPYDDSVEGASAGGKPDPYPNTTYWVRNYQGLLSKLGVETRRTSLRHIPPADRIGHLNSIQALEILA
ncbi:class I SAM-dependent methyltransferase [Rhizobium leguminosarum]|uniref:class I SAM-dependent methyltransferase n=1 Tax=Rhizobium leguminosarum TaxID=384 RepID=UPI001A913CAB|nr:class I SAM-dependent methyltransferase [Rhizobium leguminosarum]MBY5553713.1 class I SAM-dependent methyltransferase [Rhizobium leguminosarum]QSW24873.1 class I SAM-dependent methyltransferase [Rhizobium leguminosarum]